MNPKFLEEMSQFEYDIVQMTLVEMGQNVLDRLDKMILYFKWVHEQNKTDATKKDLLKFMDIRKKLINDMDILVRGLILYGDDD